MEVVFPWTIVSSVKTSGNGFGGLLKTALYYSVLISVIIRFIRSLNRDTKIFRLFLC